MSVIDKLQINLNELSDLEIGSLYQDLLLFSNLNVEDWKPHEKQKQFHMSTKKGRIMLGSNRSGKSEVGTLESIFFATGQYPKWYPQEGKLPVPNIGRIIVSDFGKGFSTVLKTKLDKWLPSNLIKSVRKNHEGFAERYFLKNGSMFDICTHQQDQDVFEGWAGHWAWFDEPPPRYAYIGTIRGLIDYAGRFYMTMTPLSEPWIYDELIAKEENDIEIIYVNIYDNPYLLKNEVDWFEKNLSEDEKEARIHGKFLHLTGLVYKNIHAYSHYVNLDLDNPNSPASKSKKLWYFVLDPHDRRPHCGIWAYITPNNKLYVAYELYQEGTITELSAYIRVFEREHGIYNAIRIGDPNKLETPNSINGLKLKDEFSKYGIYFDTKIDDNISRGHMAVREVLWFDSSKPLDGLNSPNLLFSEYVPKTKEMFSKYVFNDWKGVSKDSKNPRETPKDVFKDFPDCCRYLVMKNPHYWDESNEIQEYHELGRTGYR